MEKVVSSIVEFLAIAFIICFTPFMIAYLRNLKKEQQEKDDKDILEAKLEQERGLERSRRKSSKYVLENNPTTFEIERILMTDKDPIIRQMAINAALVNKDTMLLYRLMFECDFVSDIVKNRIAMIINGIKFDKLADQDCRAVILEYSFLENNSSEWSAWWKLWKPKLEARARRAEYLQEQENIRQTKIKEQKKIRQAQEVRFLQAVANGERVCMSCRTIDPEYFLCGCCKTCRGGSSYYGLCYIHDDSD